MKIVFKNKPGEPYQAAKELALEGKRMLRLRQVGVKPEHPDYNKIKLVTGQILQEMHETGCWLACDCMGDVSQPPILAPRQCAPGVYTLMRLADRGPHASECPYQWEEGELAGRQQQTNPQGKQRQDRPDFLMYKSEEPEAADHDKDKCPRDGAKRAQSMDSMQRRLYWLLKETGLNRLDHSTPSIQEQLELIREAAKKVPLVDKVTLADVLWTQPKWITEGWVLSKFRKLAKEGWPARTPLQGYLVISAHDITGQNIEVAEGHKLTVKGKVSKLAKDGMDARAPYLVILSVKYDRKSDTCELMRAFAQPRRKPSLFPVDSDLERDAADLLAEVTRSVHRKTDGQVSLVVEKPLFDIEPAPGQPACRPDFLLSAGGFTLVVETMGSQETSYRTRKAGTHAVMRMLGPLFEDERASGSKDEANDRLKRYVYGWLKGTGAFG